MNPIADPQPIHDIAQPGANSVGRPEHSNVPIHAAPSSAPAAANPIAGGSLARPIPAAPQPQQPEEPAKEPPQLTPAVAKKPAGPAKPIIEITLAVLVALGLAAAAYLAFRKSS